MSDLISRAALLDAMPKNDELLSLDVRRVICDAPAVDAVEVVRCRECRLWRRVEKHSGKCPFLIGEHQYTGDDHFCSLAEKREDGEGEMLKDRIGKLLEIMAEFNEANDNCDGCPFYDGWCEGTPGGGCIVEDLTDIVRIVVRKDLLKEDGGATDEN